MANDFTTVGGNDVYTAPGPGASVANTLQSILAERRATQRQAMLDELTRKRTDSESEVAHENAASLKAQREAAIQTQEQTIADKKKKNNQLANISGYYSQQWDEDPIIQRANENISLNPESQDELEKVILQRKLAIEEKKAKSHGHVYRTDAQGNPIDTHIQSSTEADHFIPFVHPPAAPAQGSVAWSGEGMVNGVKTPIFMLNKFDKQGHPIVVDINGNPYRGNIEKPGAQNGKPLVTPGESSHYATARGKATDVPSGFLGIGGRPATDQDKAAFAQLEQNIYSRFPSSISALAKEIIASEDPSTPNEQVVEHAVQQGAIKPEEKDILYQLLEVVR